MHYTERQANSLGDQQQIEKNQLHQQKTPYKLLLIAASTEDSLQTPFTKSNPVTTLN
jgi:hypothetical protein